MDVAALFLRVIASERGSIYLPYSFEGEWTDTEMNAVRDAIDPHVPAKADAMFNNWLFVKRNTRFSASRSTWTMGSLSANTPAGLAEKIREYYKS